MSINSNTALGSSYTSLVEVGIVPEGDAWQDLAKQSGEGQRFDNKSEESKAILARILGRLIKAGEIDRNNYNFHFPMNGWKFTFKASGKTCRYACAFVAHGKADEIQTQFKDKFSVHQAIGMRKLILQGYGEFVEDCDLTVWDVDNMNQAERSVYLTKHQMSEASKVLDGVNNQLKTMNRLCQKLLGVKSDTERMTDLAKALTKVEGAIKNLEGNIPEYVDVVKANEFLAKTQVILTTKMPKAST